MNREMKLACSLMVAAAAFAGASGCKSQASQMDPSTATDPMKRPTVGSEAPKGEMIQPMNAPGPAGGVSPGHMGR